MADLTLLLGENNTGKTFFATVLHRVLVAPRSEAWPRGRLIEQEVPTEVLDWLETQVAVADVDTAGEFGLEWPVPETVSRWAVDYSTARLRAFGVSVREGIEYAYGSEASELRRRTPKRRSGDCFLRIRSAEPDWEVEVRFDSSEIRVEPPDPEEWLQQLIGVEETRRQSPPARDRHPNDWRHSAAGDFTTRWTWYWVSRDGLFRNLPRSPVHLPANRTGFMLSYQILAAEMVRQSASAGVRPTGSNSLPGTSADFLALLLRDFEDRPVERRRDPRFGSLLKGLEQDLRAEIALKERSTGVDAIVAVTPEGEFPLSRVSSMLSELAPIILVLQGSLVRSDHITIDEPEAHLHPAMQRRVASFLADVVGQGTGVVVTTHSDFFLGQINNLIRSGRLVESRSRTMHDGDLASKKASVCGLRFTREERWCIGRQLELDRVDGIDESTFTDVMESLYDDSVQLIGELI